VVEIAFRICWSRQDFMKKGIAALSLGAASPTQASNGLKWGTQRGGWLMSQTGTTASFWLPLQVLWREFGGDAEYNKIGAIGFCASAAIQSWLPWCSAYSWGPPFLVARLCLPLPLHVRFIV
jgi:hypothetical protein